jgi:hypothetical protein
MDPTLFVICSLTFVIHLIGTLAYAARIAGVRTRRIAVSFALFNVLILVSRTSNSFQGPFLAKRVEDSLLNGTSQHLLADFRWLLFSASFATLVGAFLIPTCQRGFAKMVADFHVHRSLPKLLLHVWAKGGVSQIKDTVALPRTTNIRALGRCGISPVAIGLNVVVMALWTVGVFAAIYAGTINSKFRVTASTLSSIINGVATILMFVVIDPQLSVMTDDVIEGRATESAFRRTIVWLVGSRFAGTLLAQAILVPASVLIAAVAQRLAS